LEKVIVIVGPTCSGKTKLSIKLAELLKTEIISADSRQIYKQTNIGTAKPSNIELKKIKHYLVNELNLDEDFNASKFAEQAKTIIDDIHSRNKIPIVAGGSGLYIKALIDGISDSAATNDDLRAKYLDLRRNFGNDYLYKELKKVDPDSASKMLPQNWKRVMRALEVFELTGKPIWYHHLKQERINNFDFKQYGLLWDREQLYKNIELRVDAMIENGLVKEVENILNSGYSKSLNALNTVGYKELIQYLDNEISLDYAIKLIKRNTRRYAKRQMTWFNSDKRIRWKKINNQQDLDYLANQIKKELDEKKY
jgi:tRNA dimethylallyltransferase